MDTHSATTPAARNLANEAPRSPRIRIGGYAILGRTLDKCRASLNGTLGDYHYDCPLDNMLFGFAEVTGDAFKEKAKTGAADDEMARWLDENGQQHSQQEIEAWSDGIEQWSMSQADDPEKREYFATETRKLGLDPETTSLFTWLEADDRATHGSQD